MKIISKTLKLLPVFLLVLGLSACSDDDDNGPVILPTPNIVDIAASNVNLTNLVAALQAADGNLVDLLSGPGPFTVLAPTDAAFNTFLDGTPLDQVDTAVLEQILRNHVISGNVTAADLVALSDDQGKGYTNTSADGAGGQNLSLLFDTSGALPSFNNTASVVSADLADIEASNGTIHVIDAVLDLPSVVDHAVNNTNYSSLVAALGAADGELVDTLSDVGPFTVLAPDNDAFADFLNGTPLGDVDTGVLQQILLNHVLSGSITSSDLMALGSGYSNTLASGPMDSNMNDTNLSIYFDTDGGVSFNGISNVAVANIVGTNGIIHAVNTVIDLPTIATFATSNPALSTLVDALNFADGGTPTVAGGYVNTVSDAEAGPFTVFAPVNDAFTGTEGVLAELGLTGFGEGANELNAATTDAVLTYHIVSGNIQSTGLPNGIVMTLGGDITADNTAFTLTDPRDRVSNIVTDLVNIQGINGVVHVIDKVLLPPTE